MSKSVKSAWKKNMERKRRHNLQKVAEAFGIVMVGQGRGKAKVCTNVTPLALIKLYEAATAKCQVCKRQLFHEYSIREKAGPVCGGHNYGK
jgi:hypothetical protein